MSEDHRPTADMVAIILATGISVALIIVTAALLYAAFLRLGVDPDSGLSENGTQLLTGWGGGIIGVLGSFIGFTFGKKVNGDKPLPPPKGGDS